VVVRHVAADLRLDWQAQQAVGRATLQVVPTSTTDRVALDAHQLAVESVRLDGGKRLVFEHDGSEQDGSLKITLPRRMPAGQPFSLSIDYRTHWVNHSDPNAISGSGGKGLRFLQPTFTDPRRRRQVWVGGDPGSTRAWLPGIDAPAALRTSELAITVEPPLVAVASGTPQGVLHNADGTRTYRFRSERPEPPHRTVFAVGEYADVAQRHGALPLHNLGYPDEVAGTAASVAMLPEMLHFYESRLGRRFAHGLYRQVFVQDFAWGTPGTALALQSENMVDDAGTHDDFKYLWHGLQAESLAQQWFGGELPICGWAHAWIERGLPRHLNHLWAEHLHGRDELQLWYLQADQAATVADHADIATRQAVVPRQPADHVAHVTGNAPYLRAAAVLHLLRHELGDAVWLRVIRHFLRTRAGKPSCTEHFRQSAEAVSGRRLGWFFEQWFYRAGHPVFEVQQHHDAAARQLQLRVTQTQAGLPFQGALDIAIDGQVHRVRLAARRDNVFTFAWPEPPRFVQVDHGGAWIKELRQPQSDAALLAQLQHTRDASTRQWAMTELVNRHGAADASAAHKDDLRAALRALIADKALYWRVRFNAINQLSRLLAPTPDGTPVALDAATEATLMAVIHSEGSWLRTAAIRLLGLSRQARHAPLYIRHLAHPAEPSDRVVNAAAIALGQSGSPLAYDALMTLPARPSWKNQSLISALAGLKALRDPRAFDLAMRAFEDKTSARWTLATPVWDHRYAAAQTLVALGRTHAAFDTVQERFGRALQDGHVNDLFDNLQLGIVLGDARVRSFIAPLKTHFAADARAMKAIAQAEKQIEPLLKPR
jgi:aminopeptidase N